MKTDKAKQVIIGKVYGTDYYYIDVVQSDNNQFTIRTGTLDECIDAIKNIEIY